MLCRCGGLDSTLPLGHVSFSAPANPVEDKAALQASGGGANDY